MASNPKIRFTQFQAELKSFATQVRKDIGNVAADVGVEMMGKLVGRTPFKTGTARANWNPSIGSPDLSTKPKQRYSEYDGLAPSEASAAVAREYAEEVFGSVRNQTQIPALYISNALDYIAILDEYGTSQQAPSGWVIQTVEEVEAEMAAKLRK